MEYKKAKQQKKKLKSAAMACEKQRPYVHAQAMFISIDVAGMLTDDDASIAAAVSRRGRKHPRRLSPEYHYQQT